MADFKIDPKEVQAAIDEALKEANIAVPDVVKGKIIDGISSSLERGAILGARKIKEEFEKINLSTDTGNALKNIQNSFKGKLEDITEDFKKFSKEIGIAGADLQKAGMDVARFAVTWGALNVLPPLDIGKFKGSVDDVGTSIDGLNAIGNIGGQGGIGEKIQKALSFAGINNFLAAQDAANNLEQSFFKLKSETGSLDEYLNAVNSGATNFTAQFNEVNNTIANTAISTGRTYDQVSELGMILGEGMPRAMEEFNNVNLSATESLGDMDAAIKIAAATGQKASEVAKYMRDNYQKFGNAAEGAGESSTRAATNFAKMSLVANQMNISFSKMESVVNNVGDAFLYYADNTESLVNMIGKLGPAFQAAKLSPEAITKLSTSMAKNLTDMGIAQRSFLSMQAGGPGGLRGSYQIEMLKVQNRFEEIQSMADKAMRKQFGGRVVTMEEAAQDEGAARQYTKQVQMLTQGPLKMVEGEGQARALIEAMAKGDTSGTAKIMSGQDALKSTIEQGNEQTEKQTNVLNDISVQMKRTAVATNISAAADTMSLKKLLKEKAESGEVKKILDQFGISEMFSSEEASKKAAQSKVGTLSARTPWETFLDIFSGKKLEQVQEEQAEKQKEAAPNAQQIIGKGLISEGYSAIGSLFSAPEIPSAPSPENPILSGLMSAAKSAFGSDSVPAKGQQPPQEININLRDQTGEMIAQLGMLVEGKVKEFFTSSNQQKATGFKTP